MSLCRAYKLNHTTTNLIYILLKESSPGIHLRPQPRKVHSAEDKTENRNPLYSNNHEYTGINIMKDIGPQFASKFMSSVKSCKFSEKLSNLQKYLKIH